MRSSTSSICSTCQESGTRSCSCLSENFSPSSDLHLADRPDRYPPRCRPVDRCYDPGVSYFNSIVTPVTNLVPQYGSMTGTVQFLMRRKNKTVTLQWEPFSGLMGAGGIAYLTAIQSFANLPPYAVTSFLFLQYKGNYRGSHVTVDPSSKGGAIRFYINNEQTSTEVAMGDAFTILAGTITWILE